MLYNLGVKTGWGARGLDRRLHHCIGWGKASLIEMEGSSAGELVSRKLKA